jgi:hypothetical protein
VASEKVKDKEANEGQCWPGVRTLSLDQTTHGIRANPRTSAGSRALRVGGEERQVCGPQS